MEAANAPATGAVEADPFADGGCDFVDVAGVAA